MNGHVPFAAGSSTTPATSHHPQPKRHDQRLLPHVGDGLPMITRWISDVPSKIGKLVKVRAVCAGRCAVLSPLVRANSAPVYARIASSSAGTWGVFGVCGRQRQRVSAQAYRGAATR
jgi:hypothetical protein